MLHSLGSRTIEPAKPTVAQVSQKKQPIWKALNAVQWVAILGILSSVAGQLPDVASFLGIEVKDWPFAVRATLIGLYIASIILLIWLVIAEEKNKKYQEDLERQLMESKSEIGQTNLKIEGLSDQIAALPGHIYEITSYHLMKIFNEWGLNSSCRISLFLESQSCFVLRGRYARKHALNYKSTQHYAKDEGIVGMAWKSGEEFHSGFPDPKRNNGNNGYVEKMENAFGLNPDVIRALQMKSRTFYARTVLDHQGKKPVGVLVIESETTGELKKGDLDAAFNAEHDLLQNLLLDMFKGMEVTPDVASAFK